MGHTEINISRLLVDYVETSLFISLFKKFFVFIFDFRKRGSEGGREGEKY